MKDKLPGAYQVFAKQHPEVMQAYEALGDVCTTSGPLDRKTAELVKIGLAVGARLEGAVHSHVRRALAAGASADEVRHAVRLALTTVGFPTMMAALSWTNDLLGEG